MFIILVQFISTHLLYSQDYCLGRDSMYVHKRSLEFAINDQPNINFLVAVIIIKTYPPLTLQIISLQTIKTSALPLGTYHHHKMIHMQLQSSMILLRGAMHLQSPMKVMLQFQVPYSFMSFNFYALSVNDFTLLTNHDK